MRKGDNPRTLKGASQWRRCESGAAAVEFAIFMPVLVLSGLAAVDLGLAVHQRMTMDHVLRSGAQIAMLDPGEQPVRDALQSTATKNFAAGEVAPAGSTSASDNTIQTGTAPLRVTATRYCACPEALGAAVPCATVCAGTVPTFIFYRLGATKGFNGILVRNSQITLSSSVEVQVR